MAKSIFHEHRDDVLKVCKEMLAKNEQANELPIYTEFQHGRLWAERVTLEKVIWMLECDYPTELYEKYPEYLGEEIEVIDEPSEPEIETCESDCVKKG